MHFPGQSQEGYGQDQLWQVKGAFRCATHGELAHPKLKFWWKNQSPLDDLYLNYVMGSCVGFVCLFPGFGFFWVFVCLFFAGGVWF